MYICTLKPFLLLRPIASLHILTQIQELMDYVNSTWQAGLILSLLSVHTNIFLCPITLYFLCHCRKKWRNVSKRIPNYRMFRCGVQRLLLSGTENLWVFGFASVVGCFHGHALEKGNYFGISNAGLYCKASSLYFHCFRTFFNETRQIFCLFVLRSFMTMFFSLSLMHGKLKGCEVNRNT